MSEILVTGVVTGFIGSNLADELVRMGYDVIILDNLSPCKEENLVGLDGVEFT